MFGLLNLDDEQRAAMLRAAGMMMQSRGNFGQAAGAGLLGYADGKQQYRAQKDQRAEAEQQRELRQMQMAQMKQAQEQQSAMQGLAQRSFAPPQMSPNDPYQEHQMPGGGGMPEYAKGLMQLDPMKGMALQAQMAQAERPDYMPVAPGASVFDKRAGKEVFRAPEKTPDWKDPEYVRVQSQIRAAGRPQVTVNGREETEFGKALGKQQGEAYSDLMKSDMQASSSLTKLGRLESLLQSSGQTGKLTPPIMELKSAAESLGFKIDPRLPFQQAAQALSNEIALTLRNPAGGAGMPGALSDRDREFLQNMVPNLAKTPEGNKMLLETQRKVYQREKEVAKLARDYRKKHGKFDEGFYDELARFSAQNPLFGSAGGGWSAERL